MRHPLLFAGLILLSACAQRYAAPSSGQTSAGPDDAFDCVKRQMAALEYKQSSLDVDDRRITGTKIDTKARRPDTQFRRLLERLEAQVATEANGQTSITVDARTFAEYTLQRGPTEVEEKASDKVKADAQQLLERCRS